MDHLSTLYLLGLLPDPPTELGDSPIKRATLPLQILSNNSGVGEVSTESKLFTVPCECDDVLDCSCSSVDSDASSGNSSNSASETNMTISTINYHKRFKHYKLFEIPDEPPCYKPWTPILWSCDYNK